MLYQLSYTREPCAFLPLVPRGPLRDPDVMVGEGFEPS
jgi:hypothetical protein